MWHVLINPRLSLIRISWTQSMHTPETIPIAKFYVMMVYEVVTLQFKVAEGD